jgi:hypothetical protein
MCINAWLGVQWKTTFGMVEEDVPDLIDLLLKNMSIKWTSTMRTFQRTF